MKNLTDLSLQHMQSYMNRFMPLSEDEIKNLLQFCEIRNFNSREILVEEGEVDNYLSMVLKGLVRKFIRGKNKEIILQLATEGHVVHSELSYLTQQPSEVVLETLEPTTLVSISHENMQKALKGFEKGERLGRLILTGMFVKKDERMYDMLAKTPKERFLNYVDRHQHMLQRVPQKYLASYLNITSETFSRFKHLTKETGK